MEELSNVLWIGGPAGAGKTTISRLLTRRHGLRWYSVDAHTWQHRDRALAMGIALPRCGPGDYDREPMILEDLRSLPSNPLVVVEGALVTPEMARPRSQAVWLMPSQQAQRARLEKRNPDVHPGLLQGWQLINDQLEGTSATIITVDDQTVEETLAEVERLFADLLHDDPAAHTSQERRALIRYANQVAVTHCLTGFARLSPPRDPSTTVRTFDCECAAPTCEAVVQLPVSSVGLLLIRDSVPAGRENRSGNCQSSPGDLPTPSSAPRWRDRFGRSRMPSVRIRSAAVASAPTYLASPGMPCGPGSCSTVYGSSSWTSRRQLAHGNSVTPGV